MDFYLFFFLFVFHKEFLVISHNFNDQVCTIIIAQPNLDNQIGAIERVDINPQSLMVSKPTFVVKVLVNISRFESDHAVHFLSYLDDKNFTSISGTFWAGHATMARQVNTGDILYRYSIVKL